MKKFVLFACFVFLFYVYEIKAIDLERDTISCQTIKMQIFSDEVLINSFYYNKKLTIYKGEKEHCLFTNNYIKSLFTKILVNNQKTNVKKKNTQKYAYHVKYGYVKINDDSLELSKSIDYLAYYLVTFENKNTLMNQYISELKNKLYETVMPTTKLPEICYLFMKDDMLIILSHKLIINPDDKMNIKKVNELDIKSLIEIIKE